MMEQWRPVIGFEHQYEVSDAGRVRRVARVLRRCTGVGYSVRERVLAQCAFGGRGGEYQGVGFKVAPKTNRVFLVHRLVAEAFLPNPEQLPEVNHKNLNKRDNDVRNLEWCTGVNNQQHAARLGRFHGRTNPNARFKLQPYQVDEILERLTNGERQQDLAEHFGVSQTLISMIKNGRTWRNPLQEVA